MAYQCSERIRQATTRVNSPGFMVRPTSRTATAEGRKIGNFAPNFVTYTCLRKSGHGRWARGKNRQRGELPVFFQTKSKKRREVCRLLTALLNNNCSELNNLAVGPRSEDRVNHTRAVRIVPYVQGRLVMDDAFATVTKELSTSGVSVVL